jgi:hypothetical protein
MVVVEYIIWSAGTGIKVGPDRNGGCDIVVHYEDNDDYKISMSKEHAKAVAKALLNLCEES